MSPGSVRARLSAATVAAVAASLVTPLAGALAPASAAPSDGSPDTVEVTGTVAVLPGEDGAPDRYSVLLPSGQAVPLAGELDAAPLSRFTGTLAVPGSSGDRELTGSLRSSALRRAVQSRTPLRVVEARTSERAPAPGPAAHTTYVAKVTNFGSIGLTDQQILDTVAGSQAYWVRESSGVIPSFTTVSGVAAIAAGAGSTAGGCGLGNNGADFDAIAQDVGAQAYPGVDFSGASTNHLLIVVPDGCGGPITGRARLGDSFANGGPAIITSQTPAETLSTLNHEWGHNLGLQHANTTRAEYGDLYEVMGADDGTARTPVLGTVYRWEQGIIAGGEVVDGSGGGSWTLAPRAATSGLRSVVFIDPDTGRRHFVDLRDGAGNDAGTCYASGACDYTSSSYGQNYVPGVTIERENDTSGAFLLAAAGNDGVLTGGESWTNTGGTLSVSASGGSVTVGRNTNVPTVAGGSATMSAPVALRDVSVSGSGFSPAPAGYRYQWLLDGQPIGGAEESTFRPTTAMAGRELSVTVTAYAVGHNPVSRTSTPQKVAAAGWYVRPGRKYPEITGRKRVGSVLTVAGLDWVDYYGNVPADLSRVYTWTRNGKKIKKATGATYRLTVKDRGKRIQVVERPRAGGFATDSRARSKATSRVKIGKLTWSRPRIGGKAKVGKRLVARTAGWTRGTKFRYQWFAGKRVIRGAHGKKLKVGRSLKGAKVSVRVTGTKKGFKATSAKSRPVKIKK